MDPSEPTGEEKLRLELGVAVVADIELLIRRGRTDDLRIVEAIGVLTQILTKGVEETAKVP